MTQKHTPGPWRIGDAGNTVFGPKIDAPAPHTVATIGRAGNAPGAAQANASLIAAAPELLAALRLFSDAYDSPNDAPIWAEAAKAARDAIAKAEGR